MYCFTLFQVIDQYYSLEIPKHCGHYLLSHKMILLSLQHFNQLLSTFWCCFSSVYSGDYKFCPGLELLDKVLQTVIKCCQILHWAFLSSAFLLTVNNHSTHYSNSFFTYNLLCKLPCACSAEMCNQQSYTLSAVFHYNTTHFCQWYSSWWHQLVIQNVLHLWCTYGMHLNLFTQK